MIEAMRAIPGKGADTKRHCAPRRYVGRGDVALAAAGSARPARRSFSRATRTEVLAEIRRRHRQSLSLKLRDNRSLGVAAFKYFGSWSDGLSAADVPPTRLRWSADRVRQELRQLDEQGEFEDSSRVRNRRLAAAAVRYFGTLRQALLAAGVLAAHEKPRWTRRWTRRRILETIQDRHVRGLPVRGDPNLVAVAKRRFGSFYQALVAAGIPAQKRPPRQRWSRQRVIEVLRDRHRQGLRLTPDQDWKLTGAAQRHFGRWSCALVAAGLPTRRTVVGK